MPDRRRSVPDERATATPIVKCVAHLLAGECGALRVRIDRRVRTNSRSAARRQSAARSSLNMDSQTLLHVWVAGALAVCGLAFFIGAARAAVAASLLGFLAFIGVGFTNPTPLASWGYLYFLLPTGFSLLPLFWRTRAAFVLAAILQLAYFMLPQSFLTPYAFAPALLLQMVAAFVSRPRPTLR